MGSSKKLQNTSTSRKRPFETNTECVENEKKISRPNKFVRKVRSHCNEINPNGQNSTNTSSDNHTSTHKKTALPSPSQCPSNLSPDDYIEKIVFSQTGHPATTCSAFSLPSDFFVIPTEEQKAFYTMDLLYAAQDQDMDTLRKLNKEGHSFQCCNGFGESVIHMACRRGLTKVVDFLLNEANVSITIMDDYGRTPLHDAFWYKDLNDEVVRMLLEKEPSLLFVTDKRGFTPLAYSRMEHWDSWRKFLYDSMHLLLKSNSDFRRITE